MPTVFPESLTDKIISEKIKEWEERRKKQKQSKDLAEIKVHPFLTLSRDLGCGEEEIVPALEKRLGWKVYGRNLLDHVAKRDNLSRSFIETLDEHRQNLIDNWVNFLIRSGAVLQDDYVVRISRLVKVIVAQESAIILGRGANHILQDKKEGVRIRLTAPLPARIKNIAALRNLSEKDAEDLVRKTDDERAYFIKQYFNEDINNPNSYDLTINTEKLSREMIYQTISQLIDLKKNEP